ncbi:Flavin reductase [Minicystis rosea]|nr:Flavin reductase [Minicystis rosea]
MRDALGATAARALDGLASHRLRFFVLGASGRTGAPFVAQALERGHFVTAFVRNPSKLPDEVLTHGGLHAVHGELHDDDAVLRAVREVPPDVLVSMLASEAAPYTAVSTGTRGLLRAVRALGAPRALPFLSIASWGLGPSQPYIEGLFARALVGLAKRTFWAKPHADFEKQLAEVARARDEGLIQPTILLPPMLASGPRTRTYLSGEPSAMKGGMRVTSSVDRASLAAPPPSRHGDWTPYAPGVTGMA